jgi:hypothetical protein
VGGKTLRLFLVDGIPTGIIVGEIINWTGQITRLPRSSLAQFLERKDSNRTGVYLLIGSDEEEAGRQRVYVGESDNVGKRILQHANNSDGFDWDFACVISSKDQNLTKAHGLFLEARIIAKAIAADRVTLENTQTSAYENIPESDISDMTDFFEQVSVLLSALGIELFAPQVLQEQAERTTQTARQDSPIVARNDRQPSLKPVTGSEAISVILRDHSFGIEAKGIEANGEILVLKDSQARGANEHTTNVYSHLRERLVREGKLAKTDDPKIMTFTSDVIFNSPSAASAVILDRNDNGRSSWKEMGSGKSLNEWYAEQASRVSQPLAAMEATN